MDRYLAVDHWALVSVLPIQRQPYMVPHQFTRLPSEFPLWEPYPRQTA